MPPELVLRRPTERDAAAISAICNAATRDLYGTGDVDAESPTGATRLYERVGMVAHPRFAAWEKELRPASR